jgi:hypothetical protein
VRWSKRISQEAVEAAGKFVSWIFGVASGLRANAGRPPGFEPQARRYKLST